MAITQMTSKEEYEKDPSNIQVVTNFHGHETTRVYHHWDCPHSKGVYQVAFQPECIEGKCHYFEPLYMKTTHHGLVVALGEFNGYDDSDFYAIVWNPETKKPEQITYASTRGWSYPNGASVDATPEVVEAYKAHLAAIERAAQIERQAERARQPGKGKILKVVKGRKIKIGTIGKCFWAGETKYGFSVGIETETGKQFTALKNVEVCLPGLG